LSSQILARSITPDFIPRLIKITKKKPIKLVKAMPEIRPNKKINLLDKEPVDLGDGFCIEIFYQQI